MFLDSQFQFELKQTLYIKCDLIIILDIQIKKIKTMSTYPFIKLRYCDPYLHERYRFNYKPKEQLQSICLSGKMRLQVWHDIKNSVVTLTF